MELWIRSQDKTGLVKANNICKIKTNKDYVDIVSIKDKDTKYYLGRYKVEERALEILDEIQEYLERECRKEEIDFEMNGVQHSSRRYAIYEMPKE